MSETTSAKDASGEPAGAPEPPDWPVRPPVPFSYKKPEAFKGVKAGIEPLGFPRSEYPQFDMRLKAGG